MERDQSLDVWKGIGCLLMIVAHAHVDPAPWVLALRFIGEMAPLVFFPIAGVTAWLQAQRRPFAELAIYYALIALLGFSVAGLVNQGLSWHPFYLDIVSLIGISSLMVVAAVRAGVPQRGLLLIGAIIGMIGIFFPIPALGLALFSPNVGRGLYFSLFPWAGMVFCGAGLYGMNRRAALWLAAAVGVAIVAWPPGVAESIVDRRMVILKAGTLVIDFIKAPAVSFDYFGLAVLMALLIVCWRPRMTDLKVVTVTASWFARLGANSLLYFYLHMILVILSAPYWGGQPLLKWTVLFVTSAVLTNSYAKTGENHWMKRVFQTPWPWACLALAMLATTRMSRGSDWVTSVVVGFLFATQIVSLRTMLRSFFEGQGNR